jgi:hypothetical protein
MEIIHSSDIKKILDYSEGCAGWSFLLLPGTGKKDAEQLRLKGLEEILLDEPDDEERALLEQEYINIISGLSAEFNSLQWWANPVSEKNEHTSMLYRNLSLFYSFNKTLQRFLETDRVILVLCGQELFLLLKGYCDQNKIRIKSLQKQSSVIKGVLQRLHSALNIFTLFLKVTLRKTYIYLLLRGRIEKELALTSRYYVIRTWLDSRFLKRGRTYRDAFFGSLPGYIKEEGFTLLILAGILDNYAKIINSLRGGKDAFIIPEEYFLRYSDIMSVFLGCCSAKAIPVARVLFGGVDVTSLIEDEISRGYGSAVYLQNLLRYHIAKRFSRDVSFDVYLQTYENYAWEKMYISGIREGRKNGKIFGFQHAFISRNSFKYFTGEEEKNIMPLPDRIITMGQVTRNILLKHGNYSESKIYTGCALRQEYLAEILPFKRRRFNKVVVPLTMVKEESIRVMNFLYESGLSGSDIRVVIRCHPSAPPDTFKNELGFDMPDNFVFKSEKSVSEELKDTDMVLYTWTTVAVEALKLGLPIIYLDVLRPMFVDPLFECKVLKKSVGGAEELLPAIESFYEMDDQQFYKEQREAQEYLQEYFYPVNKENCKVFIDT